MRIPAPSPLALGLADEAPAPTTAVTLSPEIENARTGLMAEIVETALWALGLLIVAFVLVKVTRRFFFGVERGEDLGPMGLRGLRERGVITEEEFRAIRARMAQRMAERLEQERRERLEAEAARDPVAARRRRASTTVRPEPPTAEEIAQMVREQRELERRLAESGAQTPPPPPPGGAG